MAVDPYQLCPCGSGKKIKFCCSDLIGEMEKIYRMIEGDQPRAALRHVEQTLAKHPGRSSLLDIKAVLQFSLGQNDEARATIDEFLKADPKSPIAHAQDAMSKADALDAAGAVEAWQSAIELCEDSIPSRVHEALGAVAMTLVETGHLLSARAHLWLFQAMAPDDDQRAIDLLDRMNASQEIPLLLRDQWSLRPLPEGHPAAPQVDQMIRHAANGRWRKAAELCDDLLPDHLDQPLLFFNRALLSGFLADRKNCAAGMRLYARQPIPVDDAVEAEALAQLLDDESRELPHEDIGIEFAVADESEFIARLKAHPQIVSLPLAAEHMHHAEGPKPSGFFLLVDRPLPGPDESLTLNTIPRVLGSLACYSRQTDRPERVELSCEAGEGCERAVSQLKSIAGELLGEERDRHQHEAMPHNDFALLDQFYFGTGKSTSQRQPLIAEARRQVLRDWLDKPRRALGGKTPREAAQVEELRLPLMASLFNLEQQLDDTDYADTFAELRRELSLPEAGPLPLDTPAGRVPLSRVTRLDLTSLSDDDVWMLFTRANLARALAAVRLTGREILRRPSVNLDIDKGYIYAQLARVQTNLPAALALLDEAREWAESRGESNGRWDLFELQLHISDNNAEAAEQVIAHLREEHLDEPEIAMALYRLLASMGALSPRGGMPQAPPLEPVGNTSESQIWTPGGESSAAGGSSKIWIPD